jgi:hypothetical protein
MDAITTPAKQTDDELAKQIIAAMKAHPTTKLRISFFRSRPSGEFLKTAGGVGDRRALERLLQRPLSARLLARDRGV